MGSTAVVKFIVVLVLGLVVVALARALVALARGRGGSEAMLRALTFRIGLSIALFIFLAIAGSLGWIRPHGL